MPKIPFETEKFDPGVLPKKLPSEFSLRELVHEAVRVGDSSSIGGSRRSLAEKVWRASIIFAFLTSKEIGPESNKESIWVSSEAFTDLDPSEKTSVSFHLGLLQASILARKTLGLSEVVHVDAALELMGEPRSGKRPDLVGYRKGGFIKPGDGRVLIEAKGRSEATKSIVDRVLGEAKTQLAPVHTIVNKKTGKKTYQDNVAYKLVGRSPLRIASVGYFTKAGHWKGVLMDPPYGPEERFPQISDEAFEGLLNLASLHSVVASIATIRDYTSEPITEVKGGMTFARLPGLNIAIGLPTEHYNEVAEITGTGSVPRVVEPEQAARWAGGIDERRERADHYRGLVEFEYKDVLIKPTIDDDGVFVAGLYPVGRGNTGEGRKLGQPVPEEWNP